MKVFNAILGVFAVFASIYMMCFPGRSFLKAGWCVTIILCVWGACALFEVITKKLSGKDGKMTVFGAVLSILAGIAAAAVTVIAVFKPGLSLVLDLTVTWIFVVWMIYSGISSIISSVSILKPMGGSKWIWSLILGIFTLIAGLYGVCHTLLMMQTIGLLMGVLFMVYGIRLIGSVFE